MLEAEVCLGWSVGPRRIGRAAAEHGVVCPRGWWQCSLVAGEGLAGSSKRPSPRAYTPANPCGTVAIISCITGALLGTRMNAWGWQGRHVWLARGYVVVPELQVLRQVGT